MPSRSANVVVAVSTTAVTALHTVKDEPLGGLTVPLSFGPDGASPAPCYFVMQRDGTGNGFKLALGSKHRCLCADWCRPRTAPGIEPE